VWYLLTCRLPRSGAVGACPRRRISVSYSFIGPVRSCEWLLTTEPEGDPLNRQTPTATRQSRGDLHWDFRLQMSSKLPCAVSAGIATIRDSLPSAAFDLSLNDGWPAMLRTTRVLVTVDPRLQRFKSASLEDGVNSSPTRERFPGKDSLIEPGDPDQHCADNLGHESDCPRKSALIHRNSIFRHFRRLGVPLRPNLQQVDLIQLSRLA
jgi:hypothetical protein